MAFECEIISSVCVVKVANFWHYTIFLVPLPGCFKYTCHIDVNYSCNLYQCQCFCSGSLDGTLTTLNGGGNYVT